MLKIELKDLLTLANAVSGIIGISLAIAGQWYAWLYIFPAVVFDFLDGKVARKTQANEFGKQLDSLADTVSFVVAPTVVIMFANFSLLVTIASALYVCCGLWRLAKFNLQTDKKSYYGLPSPVAAVSVLVITAFSTTLAPFALLVVGIAMVIPFKLNKI
ncbi:MAG: CDP-diacylglycerol--serine O-phosphatidyltransferase [Candidatus Micrarchaeota archaeon]|nr:CDP-diacylglycerol--serine O-phosphatidyltransferase [Candidatus Micrarchaeota archaeon]